MAKVKNVTPQPKEHVFEVSLTDAEIASNSEMATRLYMHRNEIARLLDLDFTKRSRLENLLSLVLSMDPNDPLDEVDEVEDDFLISVGLFRQC